MKHYETFGECLQRILAEADMSASQAARLVNFRSRNSLFRILSGDTGYDVDARFFARLKEAVGEQWSQARWDALEEALEIKRVGVQQHLCNRAFFKLLEESGSLPDYCVEQLQADGRIEAYPLTQLLKEWMQDSQLEIVITGCCENGLFRLLAECLGNAGDEGKVSIRHYIDIQEEAVVANILGALPLVSKPWYNARLVEAALCPPETLALYQLNAMYIRQTKDAETCWHQLTQYDASRFVYARRDQAHSPIVGVLDRFRFELELLKPLKPLGDQAEAFLEYIEQCRQLEHDCVIYSIMPDICFNCLPRDVLEQSIREGFQQAGIVDSEALEPLMNAMIEVHQARYDNMFQKHKATHLVFSLPAMEQFMRTGVQSDHFFIQRAYTPEERRYIIRILYEQMLENPYFHIHFFKADAPALFNEVTLYEGKGVLLLDAYTGYALNEDHSEALITQPVFMQRCKRFFVDELLSKHVLSRAECLAALERLMTIG